MSTKTAQHQQQQQQQQQAAINNGSVKKLLPSGPPPPGSAGFGSMSSSGGSGGGGAQSVQRAVLRVNRACTSCRKHKMRCEGADDPPCVRCKSSGIQCIFESIKKEHALDAVAVERLGALENQFREMQGTMVEILSTLRTGGGGGFGAPTQNGGQFPTPASSTDPSSNGNANAFFPPPPQPREPSLAPLTTTFTSNPPGPASSVTAHGPSPPSALGQSLLSPIYPPSPPSLANLHRHSVVFQNGNHVSPTSSVPTPPSQPPNQQQQQQPQFALPPDHPEILRQQASARRSPRRRTNGMLGGGGGVEFKSIPTSAATSDDEGELPPKALLAPIEVLSDLASVAAAQAGVPSPDDASSGPTSKKRKLNDGSPLDDPSPGHRGLGQGGKGKGGKGKGGKGRGEAVRGEGEREVRDVVQKGIISEDEARDLYRIYFAGCYRFLAVFNPEVDTFDSLRERSPFVLCAVLMVAARVRDGGAPPSHVHLELFQEASNLARDTLFSQPQGVECIQAMLLLAGWSSKTGWLAAGHAIRMGMEIGMHKALPRLTAKMKSGRYDPSTDPLSSADAALVSQTRTWLGLFVFELQIGRGTGRPAMIRGDKSIAEARHLLNHPLSIQTDARLVSTCELLVIQTRIHDLLDEERDYDKVVAILREGAREIDDWHTEWDFMMSEKHPDQNGFFRSSAQIQRMYAVLFMHSIALREMRTVQDAREHPHMHDVMMTAVHNARGCIKICLEAPEYRDGLRYAVTYTQTSAAFAAAFLLRFARLFPQDVDIEDSIRMVESLIRVFSEIPAARFVFSLRQMVEFTRKRLEELRSGAELPASLTRIQPTPPSQFTNDFQSIMNPAPSVFDASLSMFPVDPNASTMEWAAAMLDQFGLPPSGMSTNGGSLGWLPNSILGDIALPQSQLDSDTNRDWNAGLQFAFDI